MLFLFQDGLWTLIIDWTSTIPFLLIFFLSTLTLFCRTSTITTQLPMMFLDITFNLASGVVVTYAESGDSCGVI